ncbi:MAG: hypothetical protein ACYDA3_11995 [Gaiellaceae bacterium]
MSPTKKRQTMQKVARERDLREKRALKQEKKDARRLAALERGTEGEMVEGEEVEDETDETEPTDFAEPTTED